MDETEPEKKSMWVDLENIRGEVVYGGPLVFTSPEEFWAYRPPPHTRLTWRRRAKHFLARSMWWIAARLNLIELWDL